MDYIFIITFYLLLLVMHRYVPIQWNLSKKVLLGLIIGLIFGLTLQVFYPLTTGGSISPNTQKWFDIVGSGYVILLRMTIMPLVFVSILSAIIKLYNVKSLGKIASISIGLLLLTTAIAAGIGIFYTLLFDLNVDNLVQASRENSRLLALQTNYLAQITNLSVPEWILSLLPQNPFLDMTGARPTSIISIVIFSIFLGMAALQIMKSDNILGKKLFEGVDVLQTWIMTLVKLILRLTPYGVMALITSVVSSANKSDIYQLGNFILASYFAILTMFLVHALLLTLARVSPLKFFKKVSPVLAFAFSSRSSAACIPLEIEVQTKKLGISQSIASFVATFGATIGQNGCAGIYPAMLAVMVAPTVGINPLDTWWIISLIAITTLSSIGTAGVGGGATFASLIVLTTLNLPITVVALLISIEPLIDMGRTALNVNGIMTAGTLTARLLNNWKKDIFHTDNS